jgi:putative peptide zinc metalloprotease protein
MSAAAVLPSLRDELTILEGPSGHDGAPTWTLHDPLRNQFFRLSWPVFEMLSRWHLGAADAVAGAVSAETTLNLEPGDVADVVEFLARSQLLKTVTAQDVARLLALHDAHRTGWLTWALHHYLFFRVPLVRPDRLLDALLPFVAWMGGRIFRLATLAALVPGLLLAGRQWDRFAATFVDHFSVEGLASFAVALGAAKVVHELGHALAAKSYGLRVPTMGVAFLVLMPVLYTDVNEAWKLPDSRKRLTVSGAGILAELVLAAWATLAWGLLPDGTARSMAFTLAATTWISSLAINLSPFMRFDGYFLVMDALDMPNLHERSFALARWHLREVLFGLGEPVPEPLPPRIHAGLIVFAWTVWVYRLTLFLGIAVLVYAFFIKVVGVILFAVEMGWFVVRPFIMEFRQWHKRAGAIRAGKRSRVTFGLLAILVLPAVLPWNGRVSAPALLKAQDHATLYAPVPGILSEISVRSGDRVAAGTVLARLDNPDLALKLEQTGHRVSVLNYELARIGFDDTFRSRAQATAQELETALAERAALLRDRERLILLSGMAGIITDVSPALQPGQWISPRDAVLGVQSGTQVEAYVAEDDLPRIKAGDRATFIPEGSGASRPAAVTAIDRMAVKALADPAMSAPYGGAIPARFDGKALVPDGAVYRVRLAVQDDGLVIAPLRGQVHIDGDARSPAGRVLRAAAAVLVREWGM